MLKKTLLPVCLLGFVFVLACASGGPKGPKLTCDPTNLIALGKHDGQQGLPVDKAFGYQEKCAKKEKEVSLEDYKQGWTEGIRQYCEPSNAFALGKEKKEHSASNCPIERRTAFERNYNKGLKYRETQGYMKDLDKKISSQKKSISKLESELKKAEKKLDQLESQKVKVRNEIEAAKQDVY